MVDHGQDRAGVRAPVWLVYRLPAGTVGSAAGADGRPDESANRLSDPETNDPGLRQDSSSFVGRQFAEEDGAGGA